MNTWAVNAYRGVGRFTSWLDSWSGNRGHRASDLLHEEHSTFLSRVTPFFEAADRGEFRVVTSFVTLIEVLVHPLREGRPNSSSPGPRDMG
jgi:hypothetical protein